MLTWAIMAFALAGSPAGGEAAAWAKLRRGMDAQRVEQLVGTPLLRNASRGHETWIYDAGAEVQFHGGVLSAWSAPAARRETGRGLKPAPSSRTS
jgi:hypothetical protein